MNRNVDNFRLVCWWIGTDGSEGVANGSTLGVRVLDADAEGWHSGGVRALIGEEKEGGKGWEM